jgi:UDP-N-acetylmuramoyl-tripeptide--D-alanyl-D-alanine ligase
MSSGRLSVHVAPRPQCMSLDVESAEQLTGGTWIGTQRAVQFYGAVIDSRAVTPACLFACIVGARHDGHDFAQTAVGDGAVMIIASRMLSLPIPVLLVDDVTAALGALATEFRRRYDASCRWIGVGGANGKTTTKTLIAAACQADAPNRVHATHGNMNNHLGVPLTILSMPPGMRYAVIELGANHPGEVAELASIAQPHMGVIVSIGPEHLEGFGDLKGVTKAECELFAALPEQANAFIGMSGLSEQALAHGTSEAELRALIAHAARGRRLIEVGGHHGAQANNLPVRGEVLPEGIILFTDYGNAPIGLLGQHNLANATLAFHAAVAAGALPKAALAGLGKAVPVTGRLVPRRLDSHLLLDDTYNANPASMASGLAVLASYPGNRLAVLGAMGELGSAADQAHREVGALAASLGVSLITVGIGARLIGEGYRAAHGPSHQHADDRVEAQTMVRAQLVAAPQTVLFKASRSAGLETLVRALLEGRAA